MEIEQNLKHSFIDKGEKTLKRTGQNGRARDAGAYVLIGLSTFFTVGILGFILGFIFVNGFSKINMDFFTHDYDSVTSYVTMETTSSGTENQLGLLLGEKEVDKETVVYIDEIEKASMTETAVDASDVAFDLKEGDIIKKVGRTKTAGMTPEAVSQLINEQSSETIRIQISRTGDGIFHLVLTTLLMIFLALAFACPIGISAAIYLVEYAKPGKLVTVIRFATESLAGIPSIIYGLFGMLFFVGLMKLSFSVLAGALTVTIVLLPVIIRQTEESLKAVPMIYREGSLGLGATKLQTIWKVVLPSAIPGIIVGVILSIGRIIGESAALLLTAGTFAQTQLSILGSGATLTVKAYIVAKEEGNIAMACAIGTVIILIILILNGLSKLVTARYKKVS